MNPKIAGRGTTSLTVAEYAKAKRLPEDFLMKLGLSDINLRDKVAVKIPYMDEYGEVVSVRFRFSMDPSGPRFAWRNGSKLYPYGLPRLANARKVGYVCIDEGESDTQTLWLHGIPALGLPGANSWKEEWAHYLDGIKKIFVVVEPDQGGDAVLKKFARSALRDRMWVVKLDGVKDPSELYLQNPKGFRKSWDDAISNAKPWASIEKEIGEKFQSVANNAPLPYESTSAGMIWHKPTRDGEEDVRLTNFNARITTDTLEDDGVDCHRRFEIEASHGNRIERFEVPAGQFAAMNWVTEKIGALGVIYPPSSHRDHARAAVQLLSKDMRRRRVFTHLGWRKFRNQWGYLHAAGVITDTGVKNNVMVRLPDVLKNFELPSPPTGDELRVAVQASLRLLDVTPDAVSVPIYGSIWRAPLGSCDFTLHAAGPTGAGKTEAAVLAQQHYGMAFDARNLAAGWSGTANSLEAIAFAAKDALLLVDDFAPQGSQHDVSRTHRDADRLIRAQGNNTGRSRMRSDATLRPTKSPRGLILSTGEDIPRGHSTRARLLVVELAGNDLNWNRLTRCQEDAREGHYAKALAGYLQWLAARHDLLQSQLRPKVAKLRALASQSAAHKRTPDIVAQLAVGLHTFLQFAMSCKALSQEERKLYWRRFWKALGAAAAQQREHQRSEEPAARFMGLLNSVLASGAAHFADAKDGYTPNGVKGPCIGWIDGDLALLEPDAAFAAVQRLAREQGDPLAVGVKTLWKRLKDRGHTVRHEEGRNLWSANIQGNRKRILAVDASKLAFPGASELRSHRKRREFPEE
jgi:hypothetical protein